MSHTFSIQVEPAMLRRAWDAWCFGGGRGWKLLGAVVLMTGACACLLRINPSDWENIAAVASACVALVLVGTIYFAGLRRIQAKCKAMIDGRATYTFTDTRIEASSALGSTSLAWSVVKEVRGYKDLVLLSIQGAPYSTLPASQIPPEALAFLIDHARAAGAKIANL